MRSSKRGRPRGTYLRCQGGGVQNCVIVDSKLLVHLRGLGMKRMNEYAS